MLKDDPSRLDVLEMRVAHQDTTIDDLSATVAAQWRKIDALTRDMQQLTDRLQDLSRRDHRVSEAPPPHY